MKQMNLGPTKAYGALHSPLTSRDKIAAFRALHDQANQAVAQCYDWHDIDLTCGFGLDKLDFDDDLVPSAELQDRIDSGELFFASAPEAASFDSALRTATGSKSKLSWRYRWPDAVKDDVLARLLALNAERHEEELLQKEPESTQKKRQISVSRNKRSASLKATSSVQQPGLF